VQFHSSLQSSLTETEVVVDGGLLVLLLQLGTLPGPLGEVNSHVSLP
jgi:hypothetical protein